MIPIEFVVSSHVLPMYCAKYPNDQGIIYSVTTNQIDPIKGIHIFSQFPPNHQKG